LEVFVKKDGREGKDPQAGIKGLWVGGLINAGKKRQSGTGKKVPPLSQKRKKIKSGVKLWNDCDGQRGR